MRYSRLARPGFLGILAALPLFLACGDDGPGDPADAAVDAPVAEIDAAPGSCRQSAECAPDEGCVGPNDVFCGVPPQEECVDDQGCGPGSVCHVINDGCSQDGVGSMCGQPCTAGDPCGDGLICDQTGACRPILCDDPAYSCRAGQECNVGPVDPATPVFDLDHQCRNVACTEDAECPDDTRCVNNYCQEGLGQCSPPAA